MKKKNNHETKQFMQSIESFNLQQHVEFQTHELGHTLDFVLSRVGENLVKTCYGSEYLSDHIAINTILTIKESKVQRKTIKYRKYKDIPIQEFCDEIEKEFENLEKTESVDYLVHSYNEILSKKIDKFAPEKEKNSHFEN